jgi:hypothetical protein
VEVSIFCDESCHLENDRNDVMLLGALWCEASQVRAISEDIRAIKRRHGLRLPDGSSRGFEIKWSKVGPSKSDFYLDLIKFFVEDDRINFRGVIVNDKMKLDHTSYTQTHDDFYYKMYYHLLVRIIENPGSRYSVYLDIKDTQGGPKTKRLHKYLCKRIGDESQSVLRRVEQVRSDESELMQLADLILGAVSYYNRNLDSSKTKLQLVDALATHNRNYARDLRETSYLSEKKVNLLSWRPTSAIQ